MLARIYKPARNAMQSGQAKTREWVLEFAPEQRKRIDPLMGWSGSGDMNRQVKLRFDSKEAAVDYARHHGIAYQVQEPKPRKPVIRPRGYGDNFATSRRQGWTH
ncbi:MAG: ETC complex I subunit [Pseudomonadota bacterium]